MAGGDLGHALVVGSPGENLRGVDGDVGRMAAMLRERRLAVDVLTGGSATRKNILAGYDALIANAGPELASVFYYAGHGFHAIDDVEHVRWQGISPADLGDTKDDDFRGISSWELSIKQAQLAKRTKNVTVILDCCYAAQMSRADGAGDAVPRALSYPLQYGLARHRNDLRDLYGSDYDAPHPHGEPNAVRLVACGQDECAYEYSMPSGEVRGAFTDALLEVLREVGNAEVSWAMLDEAIRQRVARRFRVQRPDIEGPAQRLPFSLQVQADGNQVTIAASGETFRIGAGRLMGATEGDVYGVMPVGAQTYQARAAIAELELVRVFPLYSDARPTRGANGALVLPNDAVAMLIKKAAIRHAVKLDVPDGAGAALEAAVVASRTLRLAAPEDAALATLRLRDGALTIEDRLGPLYPATVFPSELPSAVKNLESAVKNLETLSAAQGLREIEGEHEVFRQELELEWGTVENGVMRRMPDHGGVLTLRDRIYAKVTSKAQRSLYVHVFNIGLRGKIALLTSFAPAGVHVNSAQPEFVFGRRPDGALLGGGLSWPAGLVRDLPRIDELIVIVTSTAMSLRSLEAREHPMATRSAGSKLDALLGQLQDGLTRDADPFSPVEGFLMKRFSFVLHAQDA
ncbi:MAG TPA: caspase family protein [Kofleriaceae bacterium]|jgi:hypothetical protein|nr:caspase family protein [Kofleriaceae bacterium]